MDINDQTDRLDALVERIFLVTARTLGDPEKNYIARYDGRLRDADSIKAYDWLAEQLKPYQVTPLFRMEAGQQVILLIPGLPAAKPSNPRINLILFILTFISVWITGGLFSLEVLPDSFREIAMAVFSQGWPFAISMLGILGAHEFGHYLVGRYHKVNVTLPYFIPMPLTPFGTMGAVIQMRGVPKNRRVLHDIAIAGPLAGLVVAIPVLLIGLSLSNLDPLPAHPGIETGLTLEGNSLLYLLLKYLSFGQLLPQPAGSNLSPLMHWITYFFTGQPLPYGGLDVSLHMVAWAGWGGLLVTALNLIPAGQLDGGHLLYVLFGERRMGFLRPVILVALVAMGFLYQGWWIWAAIIFFLGRRHAEPLDTITPLDPARKRMAFLALVVFVLIFTPVPLVVMP